MGVLTALSPRPRAGISKGVTLARSWLALSLLVFAGSAACDVRPLRGSELFAAPADDGGAADHGSAPDVVAEVAPPDAPAEAADADLPPDAGSDGDASGATCATPCPADQFCDEFAGRCAPSTGPGLLSGVVRDKCSGNAVDALVGIAGQHQCSFSGKGSYFFTQLPFGKLKLAVAKTGYGLYDTTVTIVPGGVIHDVELVRAGAGAEPDGCGVPPPAQVACSCAANACTQ
jgi:hypothetical protein